MMFMLNSAHVDSTAQLQHSGEEAPFLWLFHLECLILEERIVFVGSCYEPPRASVDLTLVCSRHRSLNPGANKTLSFSPWTISVGPSRARWFQEPVILNGDVCVCVCVAPEDF